MCRRMVELTLAIGLILIVPSAWADQHKEPADDYPSDVAFVCFNTLYDLVKVGSHRAASRGADLRRRGRRPL